MALALTFSKPNLLESQLVGTDGVVYYTTRTTRGFRGRKVTTIPAASGTVGAIDWRQRRFIIDGEQHEWSAAPEKCSWGDNSYALKYQNSAKGLVVTRNSQAVPEPADSMETLLNAPSVKYTAQPTNQGAKDPATITFPHELRDEVERMFVLMAILRIETMRKDQAAKLNRTMSRNATALHMMGGYVDGGGNTIQGPLGSM